MKKFLSLTLAMLMVCSMGMTAFAYDTDVTYVGEKTSVDETTGEATHTESYKVTVPAEMAPGGESEVKVEGTWPTTRQLKVTAPESVTLTCDIDSTTKTLTIDFDDMTVGGSNTSEISETADISVADISDALFGNWEGTFTYEVAMEDVN